MKGKSKCKILKDIRKKIAEENDIAYITSECRHQGDCAGTCPKCEEELRYLEQELKKRQAAGKAIAVAGIAAALVVGSTGCALSDTETLTGDTPYYEEQTEKPTEEELVLMGDIPAETELSEETDVPVEPLMDDLAVIETEESCGE